MKLKELVANSFPRVRGKKKKSPTLATGSVSFSTGPSQSSATVPVTVVRGGGQDLPLASQASAILAASSYPVIDDGYVRPDFGVGVGLEPANSRSSFTTFFPLDCQQRRVVSQDTHAAGLKWHGNALYRGLHGNGVWDTTTERVFSTEVVSSKYPRGGSGPMPYRGMTTSHSAEGISAHQLLSMSRSGYDARMTVSEYAGSCSSQMSVISESAVEAYSSALRQRQHYLNYNHQSQPLANLNAHYHQHSHQHFHHYHHHHHHPPPVRGMPLTQQQPAGQHLPTHAPLTTAAQISGNPGSQNRQTQPKPCRNGKKQELGFFRKSFASLKSIRKHTSGHNNNNTFISPAPAKPGCVAPLTKANLEASEHLRCSVCPYPDHGGVTSAGALCSDNAGPAKPKRKGFRGLSKSKIKKQAGGKENRKESGEVSSCFSDNDAQSMIVAVGQPIAERSVPDLYPSWERPRHRECSVDSFSSSRVCDGSRESSCFRELDPSGYDSASMSGYDSDFPRGAKAHRSRSRIRTNPWLPSPQPSLGVCGGSRRFGGASGWREDPAQLRESQEEMVSFDNEGCLMSGPPSSPRTIARSASFEHRRPATLKSMTVSYHPGCQNFPSVKLETVNSDTETTSANRDGSCIQDATCTGSTASQRPLTPSVDPDALFTMSLDRPQKTTSPAAKKPSWWSFGRRNSKKETNVATSTSSTVNKFSTPSQKEHISQGCKTTTPSSSLLITNASDRSLFSLNKKPIFDKCTGTKTKQHSPSQNANEKLNDLNMETAAPVMRSRPRSIVSPNSEFVLLAGHLEQLANNISFEYEDKFATIPDEATEGGVAKLKNIDDDAMLHAHSSKEEYMVSVPTKPISCLSDAPQRSNAKSNSNNRQECLKVTTPDSPFYPTSACSLNSPGLKMEQATANTAHSPDSGVGGLGSTDGDDVLSTNLDRTPASPHGDEVQTLGVQSNQMTGDENLYHLGAASEYTDQCFSCNVTRSKKLLLNLKQGPEPHASSFSSTQDDDSSATISESDVDNTHYCDGSTLTSTVYSTPPFKVRNSDFSSNSAVFINTNSQCQKTNRTAITVNTRSMISEPCVMLKEQEKPDTNIDTSTAGLTKNVSSPSSSKDQKVACRPRHLKTQSNTPDKNSSVTSNSLPCEVFNQETNRKKSTDSMKSPTESYTPFTGRIVRTCHLDAAMILEANLKLVKAPSVEDSNFVDSADAACSRLDKEGAEREGEDKESQTTADMVSLAGDASCMDCTFSSREDEEKSMNASFDMSDACVQTEFDEDFQRWDEMDALESLEENALDPAESTRRWLLTGNMLGSADTGYASQTRESQIFMDDDTRHLADETLIPWLSISDDRLSNHSSDERTPRNSACFDNDFDFTRDNKPHTPGLRAFVEEGPVLYRPVPTSGLCTSRAGVTKKASLNLEKPVVPPKPRQKSNRSISPSTVDQMFCNIEQQFEEIFHQRREPRRHNSSSPNPKRLSDSSDSTLESECSAESSFSGGVPVGELYDVAVRCRDMRADTSSYRFEVLQDDKRRGLKHGEFSNCSSSASGYLGKVEEGKLDSRLIKTSGHEAFKKLSYSQCRFKEGIPYKEAFIKTGSAVTDKADYLELLLDTPLDRSNLKRPLFLVPGVGPVDISCSDSMYANTSFCLDPKQLDGNGGQSNREKCELADSSSHLAKKIRFKDKKHRPSMEEVYPLHGQSKDMVISANSKNDPTSNKPRSFTAPEKKSSQPAYKHRHTGRNTRGSLSFENKSYQSLGEHLVKKHCDTKSFPATDIEGGVPLNNLPEMEEETRILANRVEALRREKDEVYRKLQAAQLDELSRKGNLEELRRHAQSDQKETLLSTLRELRDKLERQKRLLQEKVKTARQKNSSQEKQKTITKI